MAKYRLDCYKITTCDVQVVIFLYICDALGAVALVADIFVDESVLAFILEWKSGKFALNQGKQPHSSPCIRIFRGILYASSNTGVEYCVYLVQRHSRASIQID